MTLLPVSLFLWFSLFYGAAFLFLSVFISLRHTNTHTFSCSYVESLVDKTQEEEKRGKGSNKIKKTLSITPQLSLSLCTKKEKEREKEKERTKKKEEELRKRSFTKGKAKSLLNALPKRFERHSLHILHTVDTSICQFTR